VKVNQFYLHLKMKFSFFFFLLCTTVVTLGQQSTVLEEDTSIVHLQEYDEIQLPRNYKSAYKTALRRVRKVYPLALHAAYIVDSLDAEIEKLDKKRLQKKVSREAHKELKGDFKFLLKDMYVSEGIVLSKLIYRETGMTVEEIIIKYRNGTQASFYTAMASLFDQELSSKYDPDGEDFILECVIRDIESGKVKFDNTFQKLEKEEFKTRKKEDRKRKKENKRGK
jgi:hypothetical protein